MAENETNDLLKIARQMKFISDQAKQVSGRLNLRSDLDWTEWCKEWKEFSENAAWYAEEIKTHIKY